MRSLASLLALLLAFLPADLLGLERQRQQRVPGEEDARSSRTIRRHLKRMRTLQGFERFGRHSRLAALYSPPQSVFAVADGGDRPNAGNDDA